MAHQQLGQPSEDARTQPLNDQTLHSFTPKAQEKDVGSHRQSLDQIETKNAPNDDDEDCQAAGATSEKATTEETVEYPPPAQAALVMLALLLALFLSALVSQSSYAICPTGRNDR